MAVATFPHSNIPEADQAVRPGPTLRRPACSDAARIHQLVAACKPLDLNSTYAYLLLCHHHADTCVLAEEGERIVGFVSAYQPPRREGEIFVWQVAVAADQRGRGLGRRMLTHLLARPALAGIDILETTVTPSNRASRRMFEAFAAARGGTLSEAPLFDAHHFGGEGHEEEVLLHIRGLAGRNNQTEE